VNFHNHDIKQELEQLSPLLAGLDKTNPYSVPADYFEGLPAVVLSMVNEEQPGFLLNNNKQPLQELPEGYFDQLAGNILDRIKNQNTETAPEELRSLSPLLYSIGNDNIYEVPRNYFAELAETITANILAPRVVLMQSRTRIFFKYAVAAVFTGLMALGVFKLTNGNKVNMDPVVAQGIQIAKENNLDAELAKLDNADIVKYLESNGGDVKAAMVANSVDDNKLPNQEDYLLDDKALDHYLDQININDLKN